MLPLSLPAAGPVAAARRPGLGPMDILGLLCFYGFLMALVYGLLLVGAGLIPDLAQAAPPWLGHAFTAFMLTATAAVGRARLGEGPHSLWARPRLSPREGAWFVLGWLSVTALASALLGLRLLLHPELTLATPVQGDPGTFLGLVVVTPVVEELLFRGVLCEGIARRYGDQLGVLASAALFALAHGSWLLLPGCFCFGVITGLLYRRTGSIWPGAALHLVNNALALAWLWRPGWAMAMGLAVVLAAVAVLRTGRAPLRA